MMDKYYYRLNIPMTMIILLILNLLHISMCMDLLPNCVTPPLKCPNSNITFLLYTRERKDDPYILSVEDPDTIDSAPWVGKDIEIKIQIHGFDGNRDKSPNLELRPAFYECCNYNIITVDYSPLSLKPCYVQAAHNTKLVGMCIAQLVDLLVSKGFKLANIHLIGFSLGAHAAGYAGNFVSGTFSRITALDPAGPLFELNPKDKRVDASDAVFVDAIHTNALVNGMISAVGTVDFYANGGSCQPGCKDINPLELAKCDHKRAPVYYAESLNSTKGFWGKKCTVLEKVCELIGVNGNEELFGENVSRDAKGTYCFKTNSEPSYARGHDN